MSSDDWLETVATEYVTWKFEAFPETATSLGEHKYDANLNQYTTEAFQNNKVGRTSVKLTTEAFQNNKVGKTSVKLITEAFKNNKVGRTSVKLTTEAF